LIRIRRTLYAALSVGMLAGMTVVASGPAAKAAVVDQKCTKVVGTVLISPGLTLTDQPETFTIKGKASGCTKKTSGNLRGKFSTTASCTNFPSPFTTKIKVTWADATVSVLRTTFNVDTATLTATITGKVLSGPFVGDAIHNKQQYTLASGDCSNANPVTKVTFKNINNFTLTH
jgi:hypothetical protein